MRISYKVWLVGGIPIALAAAIAVVAWLLLQESSRAREGVVLTSSIYRNLLVAMTARDDYVQALPGDRAEHAVRFGALAEQVRADLGRLKGFFPGDERQAVPAAAVDALTRYELRMRQFMVTTTNNDHLSAEMRGRVGSLIVLADRARDRQRTSNTEIVKSLTDKERQQRSIRDIVAKAQDIRGQIATISLEELQRNYGLSFDEIVKADNQRTMALNQLRLSGADLERLLAASGRTKDAEELSGYAREYANVIADPGNPASPEYNQPTLRVKAGQILADWTDRLLKVFQTEVRSLHEEITQLFTYAMQAHETEQATQGIAIETLQLGQQTSEAIARRDPGAAGRQLEASKDLSATIDKLPISPLIQSEMIEALEEWRSRLFTLIVGLRTQNEMIGDMDLTANGMVANARAINDQFVAYATTISNRLMAILVFGAGFGLLIGGITAIFVARSITRPLKTLQQDMMTLARDPAAGPVQAQHRQDELGDMARAANFFVSELGYREQALRDAKDKADNALTELKQTQAELIQSEKLASLGQLVAGVAHEINTPVGIALTTATTLADESERFAESAASGQISRSRFDIFVQRMREGSQLVFSNLTRAAELVHSFKQVSADQVSAERRSFDMAQWVHELLTSLRPAIRRTEHDVTVDCPPGLMVDTYPGALAQVITNLVMNAITHAYAPGTAGRVAITVSEPLPNQVQIVFEDDGKGIPRELLGKVFDPFFTTARGRGNTGLGLHIAFNLITNVLQGKIDVTSEPMRGTRFTITMPARVAASERQLLSA
ncbi:sporulation kinase A [Variibacter gotjawalensis]|uniref:histidine kinase n=1 Tax=Variibacter gotjawalensis TaxID=1333996 RepID=A0A0S3PQV8_9BRAD|nr:HAMP domain-containing sensor histidine kinase [Variibacter gotjawalensis]NIK48621.1 signal transduction histidine kinase [Variibacter gotjawalensis]RZS50485.1 phospho-acceptor domain-containing protein [Variibacter gotjawalensis]BAT58319.1 sporulation kinase A [Variibacter gotjawalensis]